MRRGLLLLSIIGILACNQETIIGTDLLPDQDVNIAFTDTVQINASTITGDSLVTFIVGDFGNTNLTTSIIGQSDEPLFGRSKAFSYFNTNLNASDSINFQDAVIDSVILTIPIDTSYFYGPTNASFNFELFRLIETMEGIDTFFTNSFLESESMPIATREFSPQLLDTFPVYAPEIDSIVPLAPHLRIPITDQYFIDDLLNSAIEAENDTIFREENYGFALTAETNDNAYMAMDMSNDASILRRITCYYTVGDTAKFEYSFIIGGIRSYAFEHDFALSAVESAINDQSFSDSLIFAQGMLGPNLELDLSGVLSIEPGTVNYAEVEMILAELMGYNIEENTPLETLGAFYRDEDNNLTPIEDFNIGNGLLLPTFYDGSLDTENEPKVYKLVMTHHIINLINREVENTKVILIPVSKQRVADRSIIYGAKHSENRIKLKLIRSNP